MFKRTAQATLIGEELTTVIHALEHSVKTLEELPVKSSSDNSAMTRRQALAKRLRRAL